MKSSRTSVAHLSGLFHTGTFKWTNCAFSSELAASDLEQSNPEVEDKEFEKGYNWFWENSVLRTTLGHN